MRHWDRLEECKGCIRVHLGAYIGVQELYRVHGVMRDGMHGVCVGVRGAKAGVHRSALGWTWMSGKWGKTLESSKRETKQQQH